MLIVKEHRRNSPTLFDKYSDGDEAAGTSISCNPKTAPGTTIKLMPYSHARECVSPAVLSHFPKD